MRKRTIPHFNLSIRGNDENEARMYIMGKFDLVYSNFSTHHCDNCDQAIRTTETYEPAG